jgi:hypothetical protein
MTTDQELENAQRASMTLPPAKLDLESVRIQVLLGLLGIFVICLTNYFSILNFGFLSDSQAPIKDVAQAFHGDWTAMINGWFASWPTQKQPDPYSAVVSLTFLTDFAVWHLHALGYGLTNIITYFLSAAFVVLICVEINGLHGNRMGAPAFLFAREHLISSVLYFAAVLFFLRFQLLRERQYIVWSSICAFLTLSVDEAALTLPVVLSLASFLLVPLNPNRPPQQPATKPSLARKAKRLALDTCPFWALAAIFASTGKHDYQTMLASGWATVVIFSELILNLKSGVAEYSHWLRTMLVACTVAVGCLGAVRLCRQNFNWRPYLFLVLWAAVALATGRDNLQFHHEGGNGPFITLAPVCILLSNLALPAMEAREARNARAWTALGCALLAALCLSWSYCTQLSLGEVTRSLGQP